MLTKELDDMLEKAQKLQGILRESPELLAFAEKLKEARDPVIIIGDDRLVRAKEAAGILGVNETAIGRYVREGRLTPLYTPGSNQRKFRLSEVWNVPAFSPG